MSRRRIAVTSRSSRTVPPPLGSPRHRAPHHPGSEPRVVELLDEGLDGRPRLDEHAEDGRPEREVLDPLRRPLRLELRAGDAPHLLRIGLEEGPEEPAAEAVGHPLLEGVFAPVGKHLPAQVAQHDQQRAPQPEAGEGVERLERIVEEAPVVVDAREPGPAQEVCTEHLPPHLLHLVHLGEEAVAAHVEVKAPVALRAGEPADDGALLEHHRAQAPPRQLVRRGEARRARADHNYTRIRALPHARPVPRARPDTPRAIRTRASSEA